jgi:hypothetical protein
MRFYNLTFVGLMQIADQTDYKRISEYVAAWGLGLILMMNFIAIIGFAGFGTVMLRPYILIPLYAATVYLNLKYYNLKKIELNKLSIDLQKKYRPNMISGELIGIILAIESVIAVLVLGLSRQ